MRDGTIVFAAQFQDGSVHPNGRKRGIPHSTILYSRDQGKTWQIGTGAKPDTTECRVVELDDGSLMLNMRDNRRAARAVYTTRDMGKTWTPHPTDGKALPCPTCNACLLRWSSVKDGDKVSRLLFVNPNTTRGRHHMTIKMSEDEGMTWPEKHHLLLDEGNSAGYPSMAKIDDRTIGVLYEGSQAHIAFQRIPIDDVIHAKRK
jgi:sialidase-1